MAISSTNRKAGPYAGNDVAVAFPFSFKVFDARDLYVVRADSAGTETILAFTADYTVDLNSNQDANPGGTITLPSALTSSYTLTITSRMQYLQPTDLTNQGGFYPKVINNALDRLTIFIQQLSEDVLRSLKTAVSTPPGVSSQLPAPVPYALIGWNAAGNGLQNTDLTYSSVLASDLANVSDKFKGVALVAGAERVLDSISALRTMPKTGGTTRVFLTGYYAAGDGGGGHYYYDGADITSADNAGTVIVAADGGRWKLINTNVVSVKQFGAKGDNTTDDVTAINAAITWLNSVGGGEVFIPRGTYRVKSTIQYLAGVDIVGESMLNTTLKWHPDADVAGAILTTANQGLSRSCFRDLRFTKDASITQSVTGILGGSTLVNYNSAIATFENLHFDSITYGVRGNAEPAGVGIFDCYFKNIWCSGCFYGLWLFGSGNRIDHPRITYCDTGLALDYLNIESCDGATITGGVFVSNSYDVGVLSASGVRPTKIIASWFEQSANGIINIINANSRVMNMDFIGCMLSTSGVASLFDVANALGTISVDRCTLISGGVGKAQNFVRPTAAGGRLIIADCQKYDSGSTASLVSDKAYFEAVKSAVDQSINSAVPTKITWAAAQIDSSGGFDNVNDRYVVPAPGIYRVTACVSFQAQASSTAQNKVAIYKNGVQHRSTLGASNTGTYTTERIECLVSCATGDYIEVFATQNSGGVITISGANDLTYFAVEFVRAA